MTAVRIVILAKVLSTRTIDGESVDIVVGGSNGGEVGIRVPDFSTARSFPIGANIRLTLENVDEDNR